MIIPRIVKTFHMLSSAFSGLKQPSVNMYFSNLILQAPRMGSHVCAIGRIMTSLDMENSLCLVSYGNVLFTCDISPSIFFLFMAELARSLVGCLYFYVPFSHFCMTFDELRKLFWRSKRGPWCLNPPPPYAYGWFIATLFYTPFGLPIRVCPKLLFPLPRINPNF